MIRVFRVSIPATVLGLVTSESLLFFSCYILAAYWHFDTEAVSQINESAFGRIGIIALAFVAGAYLGDLYGEIRVRSNVVLISRMMGLLGAALICEAAVGFVMPEWALPKSVVIVGTSAALVVLSCWRMLYSSALTNGVGAQKVLFLGSSPLAFTIAEQLQVSPELGIKPVGYLADGSGDTNVIPYVGHVADLTSTVHRLNPDRLVIATSEPQADLPTEELLNLRFNGLIIEEATTLYEEAFGRICVSEIRPLQLILSNRLGPRRWKVRIQNIYSIIIAVAALVVTLPILVIVAAIIRLTSRGAVIYRQTRVGLNGHPFTLYKFRSMCADAERGTGAVWASQNDQRVTGFGRFLRKSRLDELPQLFNVVKGEMAIVGPRPERPEFVRDLNLQIPFYPQRHCVKPGITGWAQINHQYGDSIEHTKTKLEYDLYYIKNLSPSLDLYIMFQTAKTILLSRGAR
jgi:sugar transferase (PEP-CTERM system associated)